MSLQPNTAGAAPGTSGAPKKVSLHLGNLPSKKTFQASWPRTPSKVRLGNTVLSTTLTRNTQIDPNNPPWPAYRGYHEYSFAYATMGHRLPTILGKAIEDTIRTLNEQYSEEKITDLVACIDRMDVLMVDLSGNAKLRPIIDDNEADVALWNKEIAKYFQGAWYHSHGWVWILTVFAGKDFMNAPWLFAEAYKYRRLHEAFSVSKFWQDYDVFYRQKVRFESVHICTYVDHIAVRNLRPLLRCCL